MTAIHGNVNKINILDFGLCCLMDSDWIKLIN